MLVSSTEKANKALEARAFSHATPIVKSYRTICTLRDAVLVTR